MKIQNWLNLFSLAFMQRAIVAGILLGILGGILGCFLILRRLSLFGDTLGHASMLGVVIGALFNLPEPWTLIIFMIIYGLGVVYLMERTNLESDTILGISLSASIALGTIGFNFLPGYRGNLLSILLGDILAIGNIDLILLGILLIITVISLYWCLPDQILLTLNADLAKVQGIPVQSYRYLFIILLSITIALTIRAVGILLINGFLLIPAATSRLICKQFIPFLWLSATMGAMSGIIGMIISGSFDLPSGPSIILVQIMGFLVGVFFFRF
jgi:zinc/manganese transport system permease protein